MDIINKTLDELKQLDIKGELTNIVVTRNPGPWTMSYVQYEDGSIGCGCANNEGNAPPDEDSIRKYMKQDVYDISEQLYSKRDDVFINSLRVSLASALSYRLINDNGYLKENNYEVEPLEDTYLRSGLFSFVKETDVVAIVGFASWWIPGLSERVRELHLTDLKDPVDFRVLDFEPEKHNVRISQAEKNEDVLGKADVVYITGETISNNTVDQVLKYSINARKRIFFGPTSSFYPKALFDSGVDASYMVLFPNTAQFKRLFALSRGYWYKTNATKKILVTKNKEKSV